jgi:hypothetical protein
LASWRKVEAEAPELAALKGDSHMFRAEITELVVVRLDDAREHLVIESWHPGRGVARLDR